MNLLEHRLIQPKYNSRTSCQFTFNNDRLGVILPFSSNINLEDPYNNILKNKEADIGYYELRNLSNSIEMQDPDKIIDIIIGIIDKKLKILSESIFVDNSEIDMDMYIQVWNEYKNFSDQLYHIIRNHQTFMIEKNIKIGKITHDIIGIIQLCMFYDNIVKDRKTLSDISNGNVDINKDNVEQLIDYIDSIRSFILMKVFTTVDFEKIYRLIKNIMEQTTITNVMCAYIDDLLKKIRNETVTGSGESVIIKKIYKITTILTTYSNKNKVMICYQKFLQTRILDLSYDNLELEIEIIRRMSGLLGKENSQKLIDIVIDIINTKKVNKSIQSVEIKISSEKYQKMKIRPKIINPIVVNKRIWNIYNTSDMEINYPKEIQCYLDIISKSYLPIYNDNYVINWQPTISAAKIEAYLNFRRIIISCNMFQCILMMYLNDHPSTTVEQFSKDTSIYEELSGKIFKSLEDANLIVFDSDEDLYTINSKYTGNINLDIRKNFINSFE